MKTMIRALLLALLSSLVVLPAGAAQTGSAAWTTDGWFRFSGELRAGPGRSYPVTARIAEGVRVRVDRCTTPRWCLIHTAHVRGWMPLDYLAFGVGPHTRIRIGHHRNLH